MQGERFIVLFLLETTKVLLSQNLKRILPSWYRLCPRHCYSRGQHKELIYADTIYTFVFDIPEFELFCFTFKFVKFVFDLQTCIVIEFVISLLSCVSCDINCCFVHWKKHCCKEADCTIYNWRRIFEYISQLFLLFLMDKLFISESFVSIFVLYPATIGNVRMMEAYEANLNKKTRQCLIFYCGSAFRIIRLIWILMIHLCIAKISLILHMLCWFS